ncbi:MAG: HDOD domain-containing protein, partial [Phycisphaerales bacterium]
PPAPTSAAAADAKTEATQEGSPAADETPAAPAAPALATAAAANPPAASAPKAPGRRAPAAVAVRSAEEKKAVYQALKPVLTRSEALEQAEGVAEIKALSPTAARVIALTGSADASLDAIAKAIRNDHAIALKIIRVANSTAFTRGEPVSTLNDAVLRIGVQQIRQTVINLEIMENFSSDASDYIDHRLFWEHSIGVAACCSLIAREMRLMDPDEAFTVGLLHDVGRMILNQAFGPLYTDALRFARENQFPLDQIERRMFLIDHASIMNNVLHNWGVHKDLIQPIVNHHLSVGNIRQTCPKHIESVAMVALANRIAHSIRIGCSGDETVYASEEYFEATKLPAGFLNMAHDKLPEMVFDMRLAMLGEMGMNGFPEPKRICEHMGVRPMYITGDPARDCIQYWVNSIGGPEESEAKPNLAVVRMRKQREDVGLEDQLRKAEAEYGLEPLPLIVLSESGKLVLPDSSRVNRESRLLCIPFTLEEFERTVVSLPGFGEPAAQLQAA